MNYRGIPRVGSLQLVLAVLILALATDATTVGVCGEAVRVVEEGEHE